MIDPCPLPMHHWWQWHPPVGVFIGILGGLGVIVPWLFISSDKMGRAKKAIWTLLMLLFVLLEIRTIYLDRNEHDAEQAQARCQQLQSFQQIAIRLGTAITDSQTQFDQTMKKENGILDTTKIVSDRAQGILSAERDLQRTDYQRFIETYDTAAKLSTLAENIRQVNPDDADGIWGDYRIRWIRLKTAGDEAKAREVLAQFEAVKKLKWDGWQSLVDRYIPEARAHESELRKRLPEGKQLPKQNVAAFLKTGILTRKVAVDVQNLSDTAEYLRTLADDSTASAAGLVSRH